MSKLIKLFGDLKFYQNSVNVTIKNLKIKKYVVDEYSSSDKSEMLY